MANTLRIKRRLAGGAAGAPASLANAELAFNEQDSTLYYGVGTGGAGGTATSILAIAGPGAFATLGTTQTFTGAKTFSGSVALGSGASATTPATSDNSTTVATTAYVKAQGYGTGSVTSVGLSLPAIFSVSGSPVTGSGTLSATLASQTANFVWASPDTTAGSPTFRALVANDIPSLTASKISNFDTQVRTSTLNQMAAPTASVSLNSQTITNLADPVNAQDAASKNYVDSVAQGLDAKSSVYAATTAALAVTARTSTTLTIGGTTLSLDGQALSNGQRVLVKNSTTGTGAGTQDNGIYTVSGIGSSVVLTRTTDMDAWTEVPNAFVFVETGSTQADTGWVCTADPGGTLGTTAIAWTQFSAAGAYIGGAGLTLTGNTFDVGTASTSRIVVNADNIDLASGVITTPGTYRSVTIDTYGRATAGTNPTTFAGYGISDSSANLFTALTDKTGTGGPVVFATGPTLTSPSLSAETFSTTNNVTAGTNAQGQGSLSSDFSVITTAAANPSGATLPIAAQGRRIVVVNKGANPVNIYPATGGTIDALAANASIQLAVNGVMEFNASSTTQWYSSYNLTNANAGVTSFSSGTTGLTPSSATTGAVTLAGILAAANGGTGINNGSNTISVAGNLQTGAAVTFSGAFATTLTVTAATSVTLPTSGVILSDASTIDGGTF